jgi:hypothetical protein
MAPIKKATNPKSKANKIAKSQKPKAAQVTGEQIRCLERPALGTIFPWDPKCQGFNFGTEDGPKRTGVNGKLNTLWYLVYLLTLRTTRPELK